MEESTSGRFGGGIGDAHHGGDRGDVGVGLIWEGGRTGGCLVDGGRAGREGEGEVVEVDGWEAGMELEPGKSGVCGVEWSGANRWPVDGGPGWDWVL